MVHRCTTDAPSMRRQHTPSIHHINAPSVTAPRLGATKMPTDQHRPHCCATRPELSKFGPNFIYRSSFSATVKQFSHNLRTASELARIAVWSWSALRTIVQKCSDEGRRHRNFTSGRNPWRRGDPLNGSIWRPRRKVGVPDTHEVIPVVAKARDHSGMSSNMSDSRDPGAAVVREICIRVPSIAQMCELARSAAQRRAFSGGGETQRTTLMLQRIAYDLDEAGGVLRAGSWGVRETSRFDRKATRNAWLHEARTCSRGSVGKIYRRARERFLQDSGMGGCVPESRHVGASGTGRPGRPAARSGSARHGC